MLRSAARALCRRPPQARWPEVLPRFLREYRKEQRALLSDEVTTMLGAAIGPGGVVWLESLPYF